MTEEEFREIVRTQGYGEPIPASFGPLSRSETHRHDMVSFVYVVQGEFILNTADGAPSYQPGQTCVLAKDVDHAEEAGPEGATILVARK